MAALSSIYVKIETLETILATLKKKGEKGIQITVEAKNESDQYGQNVWAYVSQTEEQRKAKAQRFTVGNGKVFWTDGSVVIGQKKQEAQSVQSVQAEVIPNTATDGSEPLPF